MEIKQYGTINALRNHLQITYEQGKQNPLLSAAFCMYNWRM